MVWDDSRSILFSQLNAAFLVYRAPRYQNAAFINLSSSSLTLILFVVALLYCLRENKLRREGKRDHRLDGLDTEGIEDLGHSHPRVSISSVQHSCLC